MTGSLLSTIPRGWHPPTLLIPWPRCPWCGYRVRLDRPFCVCAGCQDLEDALNDHHAGLLQPLLRVV